MFVCQKCERYVREGSTSCPFCQAAIAAPEEAPHVGTLPRLSRAAAHAVRAALIAAPGAILACTGAGDPDPAGGAGGQVSTGGSQSSGGAVASGGKASSGVGGEIDIEPGGAAGNGGEGGFVGIPIYGGPFPDMMQAKV